MTSHNQQDIHKQQLCVSTVGNRVAYSCRVVRHQCCLSAEKATKNSPKIALPRELHRNYGLRIYLQHSCTTTPLGAQLWGRHLSTTENPARSSPKTANVLTVPI